MNIVRDGPFLSSLMSNSSVRDLQYDLSCKLYRFSTFAKFPSSVAVSERSLADAGFYYTGVNDRVKCFSCGLMLDNWKSGDIPIEKHKCFYPSCSFAQSLSSSGLVSSSCSAFSPPFITSLSAPSSPTPLLPPPPQSIEHAGCVTTTSNSFSQGPAISAAVENLNLLHMPCLHNADMSSEEARIKSFHSWPLTFLSSEELAKAGFYFVGPGDKVACFSCGGQLKNLEPRDDVVSEHRRHYPDCSFVSDKLQSRKPQENCKHAVSNPDMRGYVARVNTFINWPPRIPVRPEQLAWAGFYYVGRSDDVKCFCCDGGLRCWESGDDPWVEHAKWFPRCEYLLLARGQEFVNQVQARFPHLFEQLLSSAKRSAREDLDPSNLPLEEQLRRLQEERTCKVCTDKEVSVVFIPCGHLVVCKECAPSLTQCPICRSTIKGTVRTFLS
ncbi:baculoviral IAP repeat-containing protein 2-like isoform X2 [Protopterus annectens]|uniref:baculoviral IAP repeat-containing protein 2-like isoform X2 n=1 Tax=Protopterus annectens TaxID=7888 RepID=UPI001CFADCF9|nr:baculoviral IAP repeat-containing protein 2-like isoform X2 [Protopterus annectens]